MHPATPIYYAQLITPRAGHPTARVLICTHIRTQPDGRLRLKTPHTKWGLAAPKQHTTTDPTDAQRLLTRRVGEEIDRHVTAIRDLKSALRRHNATCQIAFAATPPK